MSRSLPVRLLGAWLLSALAALTLAAPREIRQRATLTGVLVVVQEDDFARARSRLVHFFNDTATTEIYTLTFDGVPARRLRSVATVTVSGLLRGHELHVDSEPGGLVVLDRAVGEPVDERSAVVLIVDFADHTVDCSDAEVTELMFGEQDSVDGMYREASFGALAFPGDTDGDGAADVFRVDADMSLGDACLSQVWAAAANDAAMSLGIDLSPYEHRVYVLPDEAQCSWAGRATLGCIGPCMTWVRTCGLADVYAHELGHNLGLYHASTDDNADGAVDCEYCDRSDVMGIGGIGLRQLNGPHKLQMDWLPPEQVLEARPGEQLHVLSPLETEPALAAYPQILRLDRPDSPDDYYLSYRRRIGYDQSLGGTYAERLNIHSHTGGSSNTLFLAALVDGEEYLDEPNGIRITQVSHDADSVTVLVEMAGCQAAAPLVALAPESGQGDPGEELIYTGTLINGDDPSCDRATFDLTASVPEGFSAGLSASSLELAPGDEGGFELTVVSPPEAADGSYEVRVSVADGEVEIHAAETSAAYVINAVPPDSVSGLAGAAVQRNRVRLGWAAGDDGGATTVGYRVYRDGEPIATTPRTRFVDLRVAAGRTYSYVVTAVDSAGRESAPGSPIDVTVSGGARIRGEGAGVSR
jgi:hypothetical protein